MLRSYPLTRLRRTRLKKFVRRLCSETTLTIDDLIYPIFIVEGKDSREPIPSMPGIDRINLKLLSKLVIELVTLGLPAVALFPKISDSKRSPDGAEAYNQSGLIQTAIKIIKDTSSEIGVISDVALDPYTSDGQDGITDSQGQVLNDKTVDILVKQALSQAGAGADIVAPSDMMDGRVGKIRQVLEAEGYTDTLILSYAAKYASDLYTPFREAVGSADKLGNADKYGYQMNPANSNESLAEVSLDLSEGADIVMVKPGMFYLDIVHRVKKHFQVPVFAYSVSGEYAMVKAAAQNGWLDEKDTVIELMTAYKRAGADAILSYHAKSLATWLQENG